MSTVLTGSAGNITTPLTATITAVANNGSGGIRLTTSAPHLFGNNDSVYVSAGSTSGYFNITVIDSSHFDLQGSTFSSSTSGITGKAVDTSLTPQAQVPTDGDTFSAQLSGLLSAYQALFDRTQYLQAEVTLIELSLTGSIPNFHPSSAPFSGGTASTVMSTYTATAWDWATQKWLVAGQTISTFAGIITGAGDPAGWTAINGAASSIITSSVQDVCRGAEPSVGFRYIYAVGLTSGAPEVYRADTLTNSWFSQGIIGVTTSALTQRVASLSGTVVAALGGGGAADSLIRYSTDHGNTWTTASGSLAYGVPIPVWSMAQSVLGAGTLIVIPSLAGANTYFSTTSGSAWTAITSIPVANTETPTAACYGADAANVGCFILATITASNSINIYRSYDGTTWQVVTNNIPINTPSFTSMKAVGKVITATVNDTGHSGISRVVFSQDGGSTWNACTEQTVIGAFTLGTNGSPNGFNVVSGIGVAPSIRFQALPGGFGAQ